MSHLIGSIILGQKKKIVIMLPSPDQTFENMGRSVGIFFFLFLLRTVRELKLFQ